MMTPTESAASSSASYEMSMSEWRTGRKLTVGTTDKVRLVRAFEDKLNLVAGDLVDGALHDQERCNVVRLRDRDYERHPSLNDFVEVLGPLCLALPIEQGVLEPSNLLRDGADSSTAVRAATPRAMPNEGVHRGLVSNDGIWAQEVVRRRLEGRGHARDKTGRGNVRDRGEDAGLVSDPESFATEGERFRAPDNLAVEQLWDKTFLESRVECAAILGGSLRGDIGDTERRTVADETGEDGAAL